MIVAFDSLSALGLTACAALLLSVCGLWISVRVWQLMVAIAVVAGYGAHILTGPAAVWLTGFAATAWQLRSTTGRVRAMWVAAVLLFGLLLGLHLLPGFTNPVAIRDAVLATGGLPYSQYVNFDKTLGGVLLLGCCDWTPMRTAAGWRSTLLRAVPVMAATVGAVMAASLAVGYVRFEPRWPMALAVWAPLNLLTTCVSEEAFFRGLLQCELRRVLGERHAGAVAITVSAAAFGLAHAAGGWQYVVLSTLAGFGYAVAFHRTGRLEMAILTHFTLNLVHFLAFTYPALEVTS